MHLEPSRTRRRAVASIGTVTLRVAEVRRGVLQAMLDVADGQMYSHACAIAFNAILAFFPYTVLLLIVCRKALHWPAGADAVLVLIRNEYLPAGGESVTRSLRIAAAHTPTAALSAAWLAVSSAGVFGPIELALNQAWGVHARRPWIVRRLLALVLTAVCGTLAMGSIYFTHASHLYVPGWMAAVQGDQYARVVLLSVAKLLSFSAAVSMFFVVYAALPYRRIAVGRVLRAAIFVGILWELLKWGFVLALPRLEYQRLYGPFYLVMALVLWALVSSLLFLFGAILSARWPD